MSVVRTVRETIQFEGRDYVLTFDWEVLAEFEEGLDISVADVLRPPSGGSPMMTRLARLFLFGLRREHPEADLNLAGAMMSSPQIAATFMGAVNASMPQAGDTGEAGGAGAGNRKARRAAASRPAGKTG